MLSRQKGMLLASLFVLLALVDGWLRWFGLARSEYVCNAGAFWGLTFSVGWLTFGGATLLLLIFWRILRTSDAGERLGLLLFFLGGSVNLIDRLAYGCVLDYFIWPGILAEYLPHFNLADSLILLGVFLVAIAIRKKRLT